jgi:RHS repeat-associated protein
MLQLTSLVSGSGLNVVNVTYNYSSTQNNGKITSQTDNVSGEQVVYAYDALNRLASATAASGSWGQSYGYDGFGNLTDQTVTAGSAPAYHVVPDPTTNHLGSVDANGNTLGTVDPDQGTVIYSASYDVENRFMGTAAVGGMVPGNYQYSYAPGNKRVWRGDFGSSGTATILTTDEVTFWSVNGQKLGSYNIVVIAGNPPSMFFELNVANYYFGGKLVGHYANGAPTAISSDRLGSIGKYYPYGQEKPSATTNGTEKFTGYFRDSETGFDYADQRYHNPGTGRFLTPDPYMKTGSGAADPADPGSWNMYSYVGNEPISFVDTSGQNRDLPCSTDPDAPGCLPVGCPFEWDPELDPFCYDPVPLPVEPPSRPGGAGGTGNGFVPFGVPGAKIDLSKPACFGLFGFASAAAAQTAFAKVTFKYAHLGTLQVSNGPGGTLIFNPPGAKENPPAQNNPAGSNTVELNSDYNWVNFSNNPAYNVSTGEMTSVNYLAAINGSLGTNMTSSQLSSLIILHEFMHTAAGGNAPQETSNAFNLSIYNACINP